MADSFLLQAQGGRVGAARSAGNLQRIKNEEERALAPVPTLASVCAIVNGTAALLVGAAVLLAVRAGRRMGGDVLRVPRRRDVLAS